MHNQVIVTVETFQDGEWHVLNKDVLKSGMSDAEKAAILARMARYKTEWEVTDYIRGAPVRVMTHAD
jgi:hypothetical protein